MRECYVELKRWHLLDDSINSGESSTEILNESQGAETVKEETSVVSEKVRESELENDLDEESTNEGKIWSPIRIARLVKQIRAIGRGRVEEVGYKMVFGFNKDDDSLICNALHKKNNGKCENDRMIVQNVCNEIIRMFNFRIAEIERTAAQIECLQVFDKTQPAISTCAKRSSTIGNCRDVNGEDTECFGCVVDGKLEDILDNFKLLKLSEESGFPTENINWKLMGEDIYNVLSRISEDIEGENPVNWMNLARVIRTFMIFLLSTELTVIQFQLINEQGFTDDEEMTIFMEGFEKGRLFHLMNTCKKILMKRSMDDFSKVEEAVMVKNKTKSMKPSGEDEEIFMMKGSQYSVRIENHEDEVHGTIFANEIKTERLIVIDPLLMQWTIKVKADKMENMVGQLADLGVKVGRKMEIRWGLPKTAFEDSLEIIESAFSEQYWRKFNENYDGTFGGDPNPIEAKFRAEPFHFLKLENNRKLMHICLN